MCLSILLAKTIPSVIDSCNRSPLRRGFLLIVLVLALTCFALPRTARAVTPPPGGDYPLFTTALGEDALFSLTTAAFNTALGYNALYYNTSGTANTATGF